MHKAICNKFYEKSFIDLANNALRLAYSNNQITSSDSLRKTIKLAIVKIRHRDINISINNTFIEDLINASSKL